MEHIFAMLPMLGAFVIVVMVLGLNNRKERRGDKRRKRVGNDPYDRNKRFVDPVMRRRGRE